MISIIIPIYNVENYLRRCIESVINQTYTDLEIILINDGSTDNCLKICQEYQAKDNRIIVIDKKNGGLSSARNSGLAICKGEYISFVDSDDWVTADYCETLLNLSEKYGADIAVCHSIKTANSEEVIHNDNIVFKELTDSFEKQQKLRVVVWGKLYKKHLFEKIKFPEGKLHEDNFVTYKLYDLANKIIESNQKIYYYFLRTDSIMHSTYKRNRLHALQARKEEIEYFASKNDERNEYYAHFKNVTTLIDTIFNLKKSDFDDKKQLIKQCKIDLKHSARKASKAKQLCTSKRIFCKVARFSPTLAKIILKIFYKSI